MTIEEKEKALYALKKSTPIMAMTPNEFDDYIKTLNKIADWLEQSSCSDTISRQQAIDKMQELEDEDIKAYGCSIPEGFDGKRAIEALKSLPPSISENSNKWIPISERLPKTAGVYRVTRYYPNSIFTHRVDACCFDGSDTWYDDNKINYEEAYVDNIIAWQENPEPYKSESEEI